MNQNVHQPETRLDRLWSEYLEANAKAQQSQNINDGIAAGNAWSRWLAEFIPEGGAKGAVHPQAISQ